MLQSRELTSAAARRHGLPVNQDGLRRSAYRAAVLSGHRRSIASRRSGRSSAESTPDTAERLETDARYAVYLDRQQADIDAYRRDERLALPEGLDYAAIAGLSAELRGKLSYLRPRTIGQAQRIDGMTPSALDAAGGAGAPRVKQAARPGRGARALSGTQVD